MTNSELRRIIRAGLIDRGYVPIFDGPTGETFTHDFDGTAVWLSWPFDRKHSDDNAHRGRSGVRCEVIPTRKDEPNVFLDDPENRARMERLVAKLS